MSTDPRLLPVSWNCGAPAASMQRRAAALSVVALCFGSMYFLWLLRPERIGNPVLYGVLVVAEVFNFAQAVGFWLTCTRINRSIAPAPIDRVVDVDVFIPVYNESVSVVLPTIEAARAMRGARVHVFLLDDGNSAEMRRAAKSLKVGYIRRREHVGAKAGNINHALGLTGSEFVAVFDCDHVPLPAFMETTLPYFTDHDVAFVQTPQYYANARTNSITAAAWSQQALFFGAIARGKDAVASMICCGTNVVFRRSALTDVGGFPQESLTEDFQLSINLHDRGWRSVYVPQVLACGLGPEDLASYVSQQHRWARGCLSALPAILRANLPTLQRLQYLLSAMYFLSGWTVLIYISLPIIRITTGLQPIANGTADQFLLHFLPYFALSLTTLALVGASSYSFAAFSLAFATFWIHVDATVRTVLRRGGRFVVTPKRGQLGVQLRPAAPTLVAIAALTAAVVVGLVDDRSPGTLNNVAFALMHIVVLFHGIMAAVVPAASVATADADRELAEAAA